MMRERDLEAAPIFVAAVENYLRVTGMPRTLFGRLVAHDPRFVDDLRAGTKPRKRRRLKVLAFIKAHPAQQYRHDALPRARHGGGRELRPEWRGVFGVAA